MDTHQGDDFEAADFVYCGQRLAKAGRLVAMLRVVKQDALSEPRLFASKAVKATVIGGLYRGAEFSDGAIRNAHAARLEGHWQDTPAVMGWQAEHDETEAAHRAARLERDARRVNEIERAMLPLRELYARYGCTRDRAGQAALEAAVLRALHTPPRRGEQDG